MWLIHGSNRYHVLEMPSKTTNGHHAVLLTIKAVGYCFIVYTRIVFSPEWWARLHIYGLWVWHSGFLCSGTILMTTIEKICYSLATIQLHFVQGKSCTDSQIQFM